MNSQIPFNLEIELAFGMITQKTKILARFSKLNWYIKKKNLHKKLVWIQNSLFWLLSDINFFLQYLLLIN